MGHEIVPSSSPHRRLVPASTSSPFKRPGSGFPTRDAPDLGWKALLRRHRFLLLALTILTLLCSVYLYFAVTLGAKLNTGGYVRPGTRKLLQHQENMDTWRDRNAKLADNLEPKWKRTDLEEPNRALDLVHYKKLLPVPLKLQLRTGSYSAFFQPAGDSTIIQSTSDKLLVTWRETGAEPRGAVESKWSFCGTSRLRTQTSSSVCRVKDSLWILVYGSRRPAARVGTSDLVTIAARLA